METEQPGNDEGTGDGGTEVPELWMSLGNELLDHRDTDRGHEQPSSNGEVLKAPSGFQDLLHKDLHLQVKLLLGLLARTTQLMLAGEKLNVLMFTKAEQHVAISSAKSAFVRVEYPRLQ
ncbi:hypothetical protein LTR12_012350 [Friedmanniomyces endolithicus]|nr:hypothetical protein LTR74_001654 [Friedmanniomyces endolithicus]KAK1813287.1 hypothetical protein LTR12_012350 [Friedmanniomyces endolithicus]